MALKDKVIFRRGYDCGKFECIIGSERCFRGSGGFHGRHGMTIIFASIGKRGAVTFSIYTGWLPQKVNSDNIGHRLVHKWSTTDVMPADLGYHSIKPLYKDQYEHDNCEWLDGRNCYYDGSGLNASDAMYTLVNGGDEALWKFLHGYYNHVFYGKKYPQVAEYPKPLRK